MVEKRRFASNENDGIIRYAILGFGLFAQSSLLPAFWKTSLSRLVAVTKRDRQKAKEIAEKYDIPHYYSNDDLDALLDNPEIDAVFVATPNYLHEFHTIKCLEAGKHVIVEKPMALNSEQCRRMIEASEKAKRSLMVGQSMRFCSAIEYIKKTVEAGEIGDIAVIHADFYSIGRRSRRKWKYDKEVAGGGAAFDLGVHLIDTIRFIAGSDGKNNPMENLNVSVRMDPDSRIDEVSHFSIRFADGIIGHATASYFGPRHTFIKVIGTKGSISTLDFNKTSGKQIIEIERIGDSRDSPQVIERIEIDNADFYAREIDAFSKSLLEGNPPPVSGLDGLINQGIIDSVNEIIGDR